MMALKKTTILKRKIEKRAKVIEVSTRDLLDQLSEVTDGANIFFKEIMPQQQIQVMWSDVEIAENDEVVIKGVIAAAGEQFHAANVMVIHVPLEMAANSDARSVADYMIKMSGRKATEPTSEADPPPEAAEPTSEAAPVTEFDLTELNEEQKQALEMFNLSRGGKL